MNFFYMFSFSFPSLSSSSSLSSLSSPSSSPTAPVSSSLDSYLVPFLPKDVIYEILKVHLTTFMMPIDRGFRKIFKRSPQWKIIQDHWSYTDIYYYSVLMDDQKMIQFFSDTNERYHYPVKSLGLEEVCRKLGQKSLQFISLTEFSHRFKRVPLPEEKPLDMASVRNLLIKEIDELKWKTALSHIFPFGCLGDRNQIVATMIYQHYKYGARDALLHTEEYPHFNLLAAQEKMETLREDTRVVFKNYLYRNRDRFPELYMKNVQQHITHSFGDRCKRYIFAFLYGKKNSLILLLIFINIILFIARILYL